MKTQFAFDLQYNKMTGVFMNLDALNKLLQEDGWRHVDSAPGFSGDILVILEKDNETENPS